ncbi:MAG: LacI family transcriptional regulator [Planctomycetes bacterium]|jgi:DNA-binding LacI/PurR family transcriptional regulator|nr:LacI family transcriptional regulator [Planctomycetota bacterium]
MGHKAVGLINGMIPHIDFENSYLGYLDAHRELNKPIHPRALVQLDHNLPRSISPDVTEVSAWICTYLEAVNVVGEKCRAAGLAIPQDVSVLSLDDPGDAPYPAIGKALSVERIDFDATAALIQDILNNWLDQRRGSLIAVPSIRIDRGTIAPPRCEATEAANEP